MNVIDLDNPNLIDIFLDSLKIQSELLVSTLINDIIVHFALEELNASSNGPAPPET